jgi:anti-anti-sigma factor
VQQPVAPFSVHVTSEDGVAWLALRGELDMSVTDLLTESITTFEEDGLASIVLDLRDLTFVDSSGLHAILDAWRRAEANGHQLRVVGVSQAARRVFEVTGTKFLIDETEVVRGQHQLADGHRSGLARKASGGDQGA